MKPLVVIAALAAIAFGQERCGVPPNQSTNYIIGGDDAEFLEFPWQISLQMYLPRLGWSHICGGSIIDRHWILTAAHCIISDGPQGPLRVVLGAHDISNLTSTASSQVVQRYLDVIVHPMYDMDNVDYDYALIQLPMPLDFDGQHSHLTPICMPDAGNPRVFENMECIATGWGLTRNQQSRSAVATILQKIPLRVPVHEVCARAWLGNPREGSLRLTPRHICGATIRGEGTGICSGDSGGPLNCLVDGRWVQAGVASFVKYCGSSRYPNVYARVTAALRWIDLVRKTRTRPGFD